MSCGLCWDVPAPLEAAFRRGRIGRRELTERICASLAHAERDPSLDCRPLDALLARLPALAGWRHAFVTTNWDGLLDRALARRGIGRALHLNGSVAGRNLPHRHRDLAGPEGSRAPGNLPEARFLSSKSSWRERSRF